MIMLVGVERRLLRWLAPQFPAPGSREGAQQFVNDRRVREPAPARWSVQARR